LDEQWEADLRDAVERFTPQLPTRVRAITMHTTEENARGPEKP
jgi:hypothetical protein